MSLFSFLKPSAEPSGKPLNMAPSEFKKRLEPGSPVIDVRTPAEFSGGHLQDAVNVDLYAANFKDQISDLGLDPNKPVYLYCRSGNRSGTAAQILRSMGFPDAYNVGGFDSLAAAGCPTDD